MTNKIGRKPKEYETALGWLKGRLAAGPASVNELRYSSPVGWRTLQRAKDALGIKGRVIIEWYDPTVATSQYTSTTIATGTTPFIAPVKDDFFDPNRLKPTNLLPGEEPEEWGPFNTNDMISLTRQMHLRQSEEPTKIIRAIKEECRQAPNNPPFTADYINLIVRHVVFGEDKPDEPF